MLIKIERDEFGDSVIQLPDEIIERFDLHPGDDVHFNLRDDGSIEMTFPKKETIEIDLPDEEIYELMKMAHKKDITLNKLVEDILRDEMNKIPTKISIKTLKKDFDDIIENVELGATYWIYRDEELTESLVVLLPYDKYIESVKLLSKTMVEDTDFRS